MSRIFCKILVHFSIVFLTGHPALLWLTTPTTLGLHTPYATFIFAWGDAHMPFEQLIEELTVVVAHQLHCRVYRIFWIVEQAARLLYAYLLREVGNAHTRLRLEQGREIARTQQGGTCDFVKVKRF